VLKVSLLHPKRFKKILPGAMNWSIHDKGRRETRRNLSSSEFPNSEFRNFESRPPPSPRSPDRRRRRRSRFRNPPSRINQPEIQKSLIKRKSELHPNNFLIS
jgi:hypothetical protein